MLIALTQNLISKWPSFAVYATAFGVLLLGILLGVMWNRRRGHRAIAQRLNALGSRLGTEADISDGKVETAITFLEEVTGVATTAVSESAAETIRLRRSLDALQLGLVLCDEAGNVIFRNSQAEALMESNYGDALGAQAVTEVLSEGWANGVGERTIEIYGPPRRTLSIRATVIDDGR